MLHADLFLWLQLQPHLSISFLLLFALLLIFHGVGRQRKSNVPPSPPRLPVIGNLHQMSAFPHRSLRALSDKHGPIMLLRMGQIPTLVVSTPDLAREVLRTHDLVFASRPKYKAAGILMYGQKNMSFSPYGEHWRKVKKICVVHLLNTKVVQGFRQLREEEVTRMIGKIKDFSSSPSPAGDSGDVDERIVELSEIFYEFANNTVIRAATGAPLGEATMVARFRELVDESAALLRGFQIDDVFPSLGWIGFFTGMNTKLKKMFGKWDRFLDEIVDSHCCSSNYGDGGDFIDVLSSIQRDHTVAGDLNLSKDDIKTIVMDMNAAGTDTTFVVLDWAMTELIRHPDKMTKAREEIKRVVGRKPMVTEDDIDKLVYLKAVIKEILRLHLPAPILLPHESTEETTVMGYTIPKQTRVIVNAWAIARDPSHWDSPEEFMPERFTGDGGDVDYKGQDFRFLPFGSGRRICPGMQFATSAIEVALANLLYHFEWRLPGGQRGEELDVDEAPGITIRRAHPLRVVARREYA